MSNQYYNQALVIAFFLLGVLLRVSLFWVNPPYNTFDDHFEPILLIMEEGAIPSKNACWECFQPPLFYLISAILGSVSAYRAGASPEEQLKLLQFLPCLYGILTVYVVHLILKRVDISSFARTLAFGMVCFLPRHIYMSAMHTNDSLSYLLVTLCAYLLIVIIDRDFPSPNTYRAANALLCWQPSSGQDSWREILPSRSSLLVMTLLAVLLLALFTKSTTLIVLPMVTAYFVLAPTLRLISIGKRSAVYFALLVLIPTSLVVGTTLSDLQDYGQALPLNIELLDVNLTQPPGKDGLSFFDFKPWSAINYPILAPENIGSFWTLITSRMWFDMEPKFLQYTDPDPVWWDLYDDYLNRNDRYDWPGKILLSPFTRLSGSSLIALGLVPLALILLGIARGLFGRWSLWSNTNPVEILKVQVFAALLLFNLFGIVFHAFRHPYYSFMKAAFILNSIAAIALFLALGIMFVEEFEVLRWGVSIIFALLFLISTTHIVHIVLSIGSGTL